MQRREFLAGSAVAAAAFTAGQAARADNHAAAKKKDAGGKFKLKYAPSPGQFRNHAGNDYLDQIQFAADQGFRGWEDNGLMRQKPEMQTAIGKKLKANDMTMGVFVTVADFRTEKWVTDTSKGFQDELRAKMKSAVEVAKRCGAKWTTIVPGRISQRIEVDYQTANCIENLKVVAEVFEPAGLVAVLEPLNWWANHAGQFLTKIPQAYMICKAVGSPSIKILNDLYHQQITEGHLIKNIDMAWDETPYFQVGDNPGRKEPYSGEINYQNVFKHLYKKGFDGIIGMEHGHSVRGKEGEAKCIAAYRKADDFSTD